MELGYIGVIYPHPSTPCVAALAMRTLKAPHAYILYPSLVFSPWLAFVTCSVWSCSIEMSRGEYDGTSTWCR